MYLNKVYINSCVNAQREYCNKNNVPMFIPEDGVCFRCKRNIFSKITIIGAYSTLITGCPFCSYSYCE